MPEMITLFAQVFAQVPSDPETVVKGITQYGVLYVLVLAISGMLIFLGYLFRALLAARQETLTEVKTLNQKMHDMQEAHKKELLGYQVDHGRTVATLLQGQLAANEKSDETITGWLKQLEQGQRNLESMIKGR